MQIKQVYDRSSVLTINTQLSTDYYVPSIQNHKNRNKKVDEAKIRLLVIVLLFLVVVITPNVLIYKLFSMIGKTLDWFLGAASFVWGIQQLFEIL